MMTAKRWAFSGALTIALGFSASSFAAPYVADSFSYTLGSDLNGQSGGSGFGSAWSFTTAIGSGQPTPTAKVVAGLSLNGLVSSGNAARISTGLGSKANIGTLGRNFGNTTPSNSNLWGAFLIRQDSAVSIDGFGDGTRFASEFNSGNGRKFFAEAKHNDQWDSTYNARVGTEKNPNASNSNFSIAGGTTYLVVTKFENIRYGAYTGNVTNVRMWILGQSNIDSVLADGLSETSLNNYNQTTFGQSFNPEFGVSGLIASEPLNLVAQRGTADFDELRWGTTLNDVVVLIPEPTSVGLLGLAGVGLLARRRRSA